MSLRRTPNPNRNHPTFCPYCAGEDLWPDELTDFAWKCGECLRIFEVKFHGQDDPEVAPAPAVSTPQALQHSLLKHGHTGVLNLTQKRDPAVSPEGPKRTAPLSEEIAERNRALVEEFAAELYGAEAHTIFEWAHEHAPGEVVVTLSMENTVLAELAAEHAPGMDFLFLDTEYHFPETLEVADQVQQRYPGHKLVRAKAVLSRTQQDEVYGPNLYLGDPGACCRMRKVEPLAVHLSPYVGWVTGLRRADGSTRAEAPALSLDGTGRLKISPLVTWTLEDTQRFIDERGLIEHPLTRKGYPSIGCATCTLPVAEGEDPRAGRWAFAAKTECGLHQ